MLRPQPYLGRLRAGEEVEGVGAEVEGVGAVVAVVVGVEPWETVLLQKKTTCLRSFIKSTYPYSGSTVIKIQDGAAIVSQATELLTFAVSISMFCHNCASLKK